jgi:hypothetical protein
MSADELGAPDSFGRPSPVMVELLFEREPVVDYARIAELAATRAGSRTEVVGAKGQELARAVAYPEITVPFAEAALPLTVWLMRSGDRTIDHDSWVGENLRQTWSWGDAEAVVRRTTSAILVTDIMAGPLDHRLRLPAYQAVLGSAVEVLRPDALWFAVGERFVDPAAYLADLADDPNAFASIVNVRYVTISDRPGEQLMDTVGMTQFGLPDVQLNFTTLDPSWVAGKLLGIARYVFDQGDIIEDGNTVPGLTDDERWPCAHELAMMRPQREVLDLDPGTHGPPRG